MVSAPARVASSATNEKSACASTNRARFGPGLSLNGFLQHPTRYPDAGDSKAMPTISFDVPEGAFSALRLSPTEFVKEMRVAAALLWYSHGEISQSKAAEIAGTSRAEFIDALAHRRIPVVQVTAEELQDQIDRD
jgi:predicted HTH domain antitoxin